ncbi:MAG: glycosyltransferase family 39 protein [candidate division KSB1 bacterium]|nr:glycosyltransferase family 39 protein [candidate division KSB1 bacterium]MDZ7319883.1 glycosyltransferase family 39 protein [candidate division KSB1 bacterium]MDZ7342024.1 glycosyltransferase family 39 protein [candidate division KSB1 bacterium]
MTDLLITDHEGWLLRSLKKVDGYLLLVILISCYIPLIGVNLYFRHDDAGTLLWAMEFKKNFLLAFDPRPWFDEYNKYNGVGGYYRPFESLYIMLLIRLFGPQPFYFQLINGLMIITTLVFIYKIATLLSNRLAGLLSILVFHAAFQSLQYGLFHVVVPFGFFFEIITFYLFLKGLTHNQLRPILWGFLLLIPATNRQTTGLILVAMVIIYFLFHWRDATFTIRQRLLILFLAALPNAVISFSGHSSNATVLNEHLSQNGFLAFILERLDFYSDILTRGLTGAVLLTIFSLFGLGQVLRSRRLSPWNRKLAYVFILPFSLLLAAAFLKFQLLGKLFLLVMLILIFIVQEKLRPIVIWAVGSVCLFSVIFFYHDAYLLEAALALSIISGILLFQYLKLLQQELSLSWRPQLARILSIASPVLIVAVGVVAWRVPSLPMIGNKVEAVKILIETNQNFKDMFEYLARELPPNARVFQLSDEFMGLAPQQRRFLPLRERAENVKVIDIMDSNVMIKVLGRYDIQFKHAEGLTLGIPDNCVFIVHNRREQQMAERIFELAPIKQFQRQNTAATVYRVLSMKENPFHID